MTYGWKPIAVSHNLVMFGGHWSSTSGDIKYLTCHVTSQNHMTEGSSNFISGSSSWYVTNLQFGGHRYCNIRDKMFLVCHMIKQDHVIKGPTEYNDRSPSSTSSACEVWWS